MPVKWLFFTISLYIFMAMMGAVLSYTFMSNQSISFLNYMATAHIYTDVGAAGDISQPSMSFGYISAFFNIFSFNLPILRESVSGALGPLFKLIFIVPLTVSMAVAFVGAYLRGVPAS